MRKCARAGEREGTPIFPANNAFPRSCPSFSLGLFYFRHVRQTQAKGITLQCTSPRREFTFWLSALWFWYFWHRFATRLSTLHYWFAQPKRFPFFIKNSNLFSILLHQQNKFHCINYVLLFSFDSFDFFWNYIKIWCYLLTLFFYYYLLFSFH